MASGIGHCRKNHFIYNGPLVAAILLLLALKQTTLPMKNREKEKALEFLKMNLHHPSVRVVQGNSMMAWVLQTRQSCRSLDRDTPTPNRPFTVNRNDQKLRILSLFDDQCPVSTGVLESLPGQPSCKWRPRQWRITSVAQLFGLFCGNLPGWIPPRGPVTWEECRVSVNSAVVPIFISNLWFQHDCCKLWIASGLKNAPNHNL